MVPKTQGLQKSFFSCQYSQGDHRYRGLSASCWTSGLQILFSRVFAFALVIGITYMKKTYSGMDLPFYGEADSLGRELNSYCLFKCP